MSKNGLALLNKWNGNEFQSSTGKTKEFASFARDYKKMIKEAAGPEFEIINYSVGHFYISGFLKNKETGNLAYFSCSDVRHFPDAWHEHILIRTAKHEKDYTGGSNKYTYLSTLNQELQNLRY